MDTIRQAHAVLLHLSLTTPTAHEVLELFNCPLNKVNLPSLIEVFKRIKLNTTNSTLVHSHHHIIAGICDWFITWLEASQLENATVLTVYLTNDLLNQQAEYIAELYNEYVT